MSVKLSLPPDELAEKFRNLKLPGDIASLLDIEYKQLKYYLYIRKPAKQYESFYIPKKSGGFRTINAPITPLKIIQKKLNQVLQSVYKPKKPVHSFLADRSIVTNASLHLKKRYVLNLDLENFFPSINFGRVRGLFISPPYKLPAPVATILAQRHSNTASILRKHPNQGCIFSCLIGTTKTFCLEYARKAPHIGIGATMYSLLLSPSQVIEKREPSSA